MSDIPVAKVGSVPRKPPTVTSSTPSGTPSSKAGPQTVTSRTTPEPNKRPFFGDIGSQKITLPKFENSTGAVVGLVMLNMMWSITREWIEYPGQGSITPDGIHRFVRIIAGTWIVGLGIMIVHEIDPHVALLFAVLVLVGNILTNSAGNKAVINAITELFSGV